VSVARRTGPQPTGEHRTGAESWDIEWAHERATEALWYLARTYPECAASEALHPHEDAAYEAAMRGDRDGYLEALRGYCRAGKAEALRIRRGAA
jgi:hypothetical protein